jgi:hypothetical protein
MANQQSPIGVTVIALITIIQGALGLMAVFGFGLFFFGIALVASSWDPVNPGGLALMTAIFLLGFVLAVVQIVAGRGLLRMRQWARMVCMIYAVFSLLLWVGISTWNITVAHLVGVGVGDVIVYSLGTTLFPLAYCIAVMIVLNLRDVRAAFARAAVGTTNPGGLAARG